MCQRGFDERRLFRAHLETEAPQPGTSGGVGGTDGLAFGDAAIPDFLDAATVHMDGSYETFKEYMQATQGQKEKDAAQLDPGSVLHDLAAVNANATLKMAAAESTVVLRGEFQARFRNISRIMDCVGCERCRLWGKLQVKLLFF